MSKVKCSREIEMRTMPSMCDENSLMSIPAILDMFQDVAGIHANELGIGYADLIANQTIWRLHLNQKTKVLALWMFLVVSHLPIFSR